MSFIIRKGDEKDVPGIMQLIRQLAEFERCADAVINTEAMLKADGFGKQPVYRSIVAEHPDTKEIAGMAIYCVMYSTWKGPILYLDDLYVHENYRRNGLGRKLMDEFLKAGQQENVNQVRWHVLDWNTPAIEFYKSLGAIFEQEWVTVKMTKEQVETYLNK